MIALDWGLSSFRAFRLAPDGSLLASRNAPAGILTRPDGDFEAALVEHLGDWIEQGPIVAAGMIGSRQGWVEAPYVPCPAGAPEIAAALCRTATRAGDVWFVPGLRWSDANRVDVMRGEETQIIGALAQRGVADAVLCLPGTHAKWAIVTDGKIRSFMTFMTGEVYAVLRQHSILGRLMTGDDDDGDAFRQGLDRAAEPGGLLHHLFSARTAGLFGRIAEPALAAYLSGLVIGDEIGAALAALSRPADGAPILLVGAPALCRRYETALGHRGVETATLPESVTARGIHLITRSSEVLARS